MDNTDDYRIVWPNSDAYQWRPENSAIEFYKRTYGVSSLIEVLEMKCPVEKILET